MKDDSFSSLVSS